MLAEFVFFVSAFEVVSDFFVVGAVVDFFLEGVVDFFFEVVSDFFVVGAVVDFFLEGVVDFFLVVVVLLVFSFLSLDEVVFAVNGEKAADRARANIGSNFMGNFYFGLKIQDFNVLVWLLRKSRKGRRSWWASA